MKKLLLHSIIGLSCFSTQAQDIEIRLKLMNVLPVLAFNKPATQTNYGEYDWSVYLDTDNNNLTGNSKGFDYSVAIKF